VANKAEQTSVMGTARRASASARQVLARPA
jgi:hypothetical protein